VNKTPSKPTDPQSDARAQAAMPWLDPSPSPEIQSDQAPSSDPADPDAQNLPPGVILPEAATYRLNQIKAQAVSFGMMALLAILWAIFVIPENPQVGLICAGITGSGALFTLIRFYFARRSYNKTAASLASTSDNHA
jgi:hypothetical protein